MAPFVYLETRDAPVWTCPGRGTHRTYQVPLDERGGGAFVLCLTSHQRTVDANVSRIFHASVSICSTAFQARRHLGYVDAQAKTLRVLVIRRALSCACRPAIPNVAPLIRTQARYSEPGQPRPRTEQTAHVRNRKPTRVVSEVEDCEKLGVGRVSRSGYQHASG